jgi:hypothetical protein
MLSFISPHQRNGLQITHAVEYSIQQLKVLIPVEPVFEEEQRRSDLVHKLKQGEISLAEAHELRDLLEREKRIISQLGNCLAILAVTFLISYVDEYLESKSNSILTSEV